VDIRSVAVYCGSSSGTRPQYVAAATELGLLLAERGIGVVYGGGEVGLMGEVANACLRGGGSVIGVITEALRDAEIGHAGLTRLEVVADMHTRKARMAELADACIALPGGFGTLEELFEILTWTQLGLHAMPVCLYNVAGFYDPLLAWADHAGDDGFIKREHVKLLQVGSTAAACLASVQADVPLPTPKWTTR
jgi:uncharacterized protein (TIGR00730 family)